MYLGYARNVECENCRSLQTLHIICVQRSFDRVFVIVANKNQTRAAMVMMMLLHFITMN